MTQEAKCVFKGFILSFCICASHASCVYLTRVSTLVNHTSLFSALAEIPFSLANVVKIQPCVLMGKSQIAFLNPIHCHSSVTFSGTSSNVYYGQNINKQGIL